MRVMSPILTPLMVFLCFLSVVLAVPRIGIQKDFITGSKGDSRRIQSYSGVIRFKDWYPELKEWPPEFMQEEQLVNFAKIAYDEMVEVWRSKLLPEEDLPGAMIALATVDKIFFASSIKTGKREDPDFFLGNVMKDYLENCFRQGLGTHRTGGKCGELNVLELHQTVMNRLPVTVAEGAGVRPRVASWVRLPGAPLGTEANYPPCGTASGAGWGCRRIVKDFDYGWVQGKIPNPTGQDQWKFVVYDFLRTSC